MDKIPFSVYDFFGYLSAGSIVLFVGYFAVEGISAFDVSLSAAQLVLLVVGAYVVGHVVAGISSFVVEHRLTRRTLGSPTDLLFSPEDVSGWRKLFGAYYQPLPPKVRERVLTRAKSAGIIKPGEALFFHCFGVVRQEEYPRERLATFLNLYGFSRNVCFASAMVAIVVLIAGMVGTDMTIREAQAAGALALFVTVGMYFRYLKFYRQYSVELYVTYMEAPE